MATDIPLEANANPQADSAAQIAELQEKLDKAEQQRMEMLRTLAEYENARKRSARDLEIERRFAHAKLALDLLPALDNLERALETARKGGDAGGLVQGVQATQSLLQEVLKRHGVTPIEAQPGQPFDPNLHQAVSMIPAPEQPPDTIVQVLQSGYLIHDRVLRPAMVAVAAPNP